LLNCTFFIDTRDALLVETYFTQPPQIRKFATDFVQVDSLNLNRAVGRAQENEFASERALWKVDVLVDKGGQK
jgi:hypothetical protein